MKTKTLAAILGIAGLSLLVACTTGASNSSTPTVPPNSPPTSGKVSDTVAWWTASACQTCHTQEWSDWARSGHAMTLSAQLLNASHDGAEKLDQTCLTCHSPELGNKDISAVVKPLDTKGPWQLTGDYANYANAPAISCLACHQSHATPPAAGLLKGMDFGDESTFYRDQPPPDVTNQFVFDPFTQQHVAPPTIAPVMNGDQAVNVAQTLSNQVCYTCHATEKAESNVFQPTSAPSGDDSVGSGDDRTLTGAHQGIPCVTCHMPGGSHTFDPMNSCGQCHGTNTQLPSLDYVTKQVRTSYNDPSLSMLSGNMSPLNIHWLDVTKLQKP